MTDQMEQALARLRRWTDENIPAGHIRRDALQDTTEAAIEAQNAIRYINDARYEKAIETLLLTVRKLNNARMALKHLQGRGTGT